MAPKYNKTQTTTKNSETKSEVRMKLLHAAFLAVFEVRKYILLFVSTKSSDFKQLLDEVFVIYRRIKVEEGLITLTETLIILDITKTESKKCFIIH